MFGRYVVVDTKLIQHIIKVIALDLRNGLLDLLFIGEHGNDDVLFVDIRKSYEGVHGLNAFFDQYVMLCAVAADHRCTRQQFGQLLRCGGIIFKQLNGVLLFG